MISISTEDVAGVYLVLHVVKAAVGAVGDNRPAPSLECVQVIDHEAAEEGRAILERRLIDDDGSPLGLDAFHHTLDG